jgi:hypothetical protein
VTDADTAPKKEVLTWKSRSRSNVGHEFYYM